MINSISVVIDTNVLFAGLTKQRGAEGFIIDAWRVGLLKVNVSNTLAYEYIDVLSRKLSLIMSRLTLRLPETLHHKLANLAKSEGVSLNQYIVYALSCQIHNSYTVNSLSEKQVEEQKFNFNDLIKDLGCFENEEITAILNEREMALPEDQLSKEIQDKLKLKIKNYGNF